MQQNEVGTLRTQLTIARNEINKLRKQVKNLQLVQRKDIESLNRLLQDFRCEGCRQIVENTRNRNETASLALQENNLACISNSQFRPIGVIRTAFTEKRAVPRQSSVGSRLRGVIELNSDVFTNPEHALDGLAEYSHLWIIYHFHKNTSHPKAKVAPPRLCGERRVGVFATRSPHRPCPIGLSLVEIDKVEAATISFFGTDMVDGTPVLDIKPYIPHYDAPNGALETQGGRISVGPGDTIDFYNSRQDPDGEESELDLIGGGAMANSSGRSGPMTNGATTPTNQTTVKVPNWVVANHRLNVCFNERAETQLSELHEVPRQCIVDILEADPRSVYLRTKYGSQIFTFQLSEVTVTCKFDDKAGTVTVVQIRRTENVQDESGT